MSKRKRVLGRPLPNASLPRNGFDRSECHNVNTFAGGIFPVYAEAFQKGAHVSVNRRIFQRTADVNTAAFPLIDTHIEFFEVPLRQLWSPWYDFKLNIQDYQSSLLMNTSTQQPYLFPNCPRFDLYHVINEMYDTYRNNVETGIFGTSKAYASDASRLLDLLGYGFSDLSKDKEQGSTPGVHTVNFFKLAAYQKIYYDHFRNTAYESNNPYAYNADFQTGVSGMLPDSFLKNLLTLRYVNYRRDYFNNIYPALNYVVSEPNGLSWQIPSSVAGLAQEAVSISHNLTGSVTGQSVTESGNDQGKWYAYNGSWVVNAPVKSPSSDSVRNFVLDSGGGISHRHDISHSHSLSIAGSITGSVSNAYNVQNIRAAFALDKLLRQTAYAPKHVRDQMEARFGIKGTENDKECIRFASFKNDIIIGEVTQTAPGSSSSGDYQPLGTIGGKGVGGDGYAKDNVDYTCKDDCIIMAVMYTIPRACYDSTMIRNWNDKEAREDFFQPEFMDLGLQPVYGIEYHFDPTVSHSSGHYGNNIMGYLPRYQEYKIGIDQNHGLFNSGKLLSPFAVHTNDYKRQFAWSYDGLNWPFFKVNPSDLDDIFVDAYDPLQQIHDQFISNVEIVCLANQDMSVHGMPRL